MVLDAVASGNNELTWCHYRKDLFMDNTVLSVDVVAGVAGGLLSLCFNYIPGLREKYGALDDVKKSWIMGLALLVAVGLIILVSCTNLWVLMTCDKVGFVDIIKLFLIALAINQSTYKLSPQVASVKALKAARNTVDYKSAGPVG
jgi:hypothetical protein